MPVSENDTSSVFAPQKSLPNVLLEKYAKGDETTVQEVMERVAPRTGGSGIPRKQETVCRKISVGHAKRIHTGRPDQQCRRYRIVDDAYQLFCPAGRRFDNGYR